MADKVVILSVAEDGETEELSCERLRYALSWHNPNTSLQRLKQDAATFRRDACWRLPARQAPISW